MLTPKSNSGTHLHLAYLTHPIASFQQSIQPLACIKWISSFGLAHQHRAEGSNSFDGGGTVQRFAQMATRRRREDDNAVALIVGLATRGGPLRQMRTYLTRGDLLGDPLADSAWAYLWSAQNNRAFITTMGVDVHTFNTILTPFETLWNSKTIPRGDVNPQGEPQLARRSLDAARCLGLVLHWFCSTMPCYLLQQLFAITLAVCLQYLDTGLRHLLTALKDFKPARIVWPSTDVQNAYYNGWTCSHYYSCILTFSPDGKIIYSILNAPGSWHDAAIAAPLYNQLVYNTPQGYRILSDTAFPRKAEHMDQQILAPVKRGDRLPETPRLYSRLKVLNDQVVSAQQAAKWGMHSIQGLFARLKLPLPADDHQYRFNVLQAVC
ncbi:hypothetical protein PCANC_16582 [Puccinia coronata f. sp. avenae]|uniref:DDE Tnp4 domain-containing protein n=1 Tax=Puccinia coronata f. sp. avenae TaxID=200324 RepID=A0A2N5UM28_9BASI|nr:hypothetical protein PCANC_16582 [Puccinia coronata f. sp. avenae]